MKGEVVRLCELCNKEANLFCESDAAFLCSACDSSVHSANFLVGRHLRRLICSTCSHFTGNTHSGTRSPSPHLLSCQSCIPDTVSSSSSSCISTTETTSPSDPKSTEVSSRRGKTPSRAEARAKGIFVNWCKRLGLDGNLVVSTGVRGLGVLLSKRVPFQVSLAASFWLSLRLSGDSMATWRNLKRLEVISGVPAKVILAVEMKMENVLRLTEERPSEAEAAAAAEDLEEGWAEC